MNHLARAKKDLFVLSAAALMMVVAALVSAHLFVMVTNQRHASCQATLVALEGTRKTALASVRPVQPDVSDKFPPDLAESFRAQRQATIHANQRLYTVAAQMAAEQVALRRSAYCQ